MSVTSSRTLQLFFSGDVTQNVIQSALDNLVAIGQVDLLTLPIGTTFVAVPVSSGLVVTAVTIIPPSGNTTVITLKGAAGDTGIPIHITDPTSIGLNTSFTGLYLTVTVQVNAVRLFWN
jgi:hypothetical protein